MNLSSTPREILPPEIEQRIRANLIGTEQVLWWGRPLPEETDRHFRLASVIGLALVLAAVGWSYTCVQRAISTPDPQWAQAWWGLPVFVVGLGSLLMPVWSALLARQTCYVLTSGRAMVLYALPFGMTRVEDYFPAQLRQMTCVEDESGVGDLVFEKVESTENDGTVHTKEYGFLGIENVREVAELIRRQFPTEDPPPSNPAVNAMGAAGEPESETPIEAEPEYLDEASAEDEPQPETNPETPEGSWVATQTE